jgi:hypothetical protein
LATFIAATTLKPDGYFKSSSATGSIAGLKYTLRLCVINEATVMHQCHFEVNNDDDAQRLQSNGVCVDYIMKWTRYHEPSHENFRNHTVLLLLSRSMFAPSVQMCVEHHTIHVCGTDLTLLGLIWPQSNYSKGLLFQHLIHCFALFWPPPALLEQHFVRHPICLVVVVSWISSK